ncbi:MAG TPA: hypothetical protein VLW54_15205 [Candidatus Acidoferrales bacterium]|nr:hypothetical protein [Candidatus Acidoferrales bacterium]
MSRTPTPPPAPSGVDERRRSNRFPLVVPVSLKWSGRSGKILQAEGRALEGNAHGGFVKTTASLAVGNSVDVRNLATGKTTTACVVRVRQDQSGQTEGVAVAFPAAPRDFWGPTFRLKKATAELRELEQEIRFGGFHPQVLRDFRDAVDYVRKTAWAVQEWQERQMQRRDTATVLPLLTVERIRRTVQLTHAILADFQAHQITEETPGIADLSEAILSLQRHLAACRK